MEDSPLRSTRWHHRPMLASSTRRGPRPRHRPNKSFSMGRAPPLGRWRALGASPDSNWEAEERERHTLQPAAENKDLIGQVNGQTYGKISPQDVALWKVEAERVATAGSRVFHSGDELGSTIGVSCDMCHPHAANTHPETYPKFQVQLGRVALLRDMINWCIEHPVRGKALASDDPRMRALEAYILAQRKGKALDYGKH